MFENNDVYLEAQIQNLCTSSLILERVILEPSDLYTSTEIRFPNNGYCAYATFNFFAAFLKNILQLHSALLCTRYTQNEIFAFSETMENEFLEPQSIRQYLFQLSPSSQTTDTVGNSASSNLPANYRGVSSIGRLDMSWRTAMGERGRLRTSPLQRMAPGYGDLKLTVERIPRRVAVQQPFDVVCRLHNCW